MAADTSAPSDPQPIALGRTPGADGAWRRLLRNPSAVIGLTVLTAILLMALTADYFYPTNPMRMVARPLIWPFQDWSYPLGTDRLGRDIAAGIFHGARISLLVGVAATLLSIGIGIVVGALCGFYGSWVEGILMRAVEITQTIPPFLFALVLVAIMGPTVTNVTIALGVTAWPPIARVVRAEFLSLSRREFVQAGIVAGMSDLRLIFRLILPNALAPVIVLSSLIMAGAVLSESALAFLGFTDPNVMSWGSIIGNGRSDIRIAWYISAIPGVFILITVLALNQLNEGLNDALNPRLKGL